jgi:SET domain-containing protein
MLCNRGAREIITDREINIADDSPDARSIDARWFGGIGRFLNHSCDPNLQVVNVFVDSHDARIPRYLYITNCIHT